MIDLVILCHSTSEVHSYKLSDDVQTIDENTINNLGFHPSECSWMFGKHIDFIKHKGIILKI